MCSTARTLSVGETRTTCKDENDHTPLLMPANKTLEHHRCNSYHRLIPAVFGSLCASEIF